MRRSGRARRGRRSSAAGCARLALANGRPALLTPCTPAAALTHGRFLHPAARRLLTDQSPELQETLRALLYKGGKFQFTRLEGLLQQAARSPARTAPPPGAPPSPPAGAPAGQGAGAGRGGGLALVLSPEGGFVRQILVDELGKGLDAAWRLVFDSAVDGAKQQLQGGGPLLQAPLPLLPGAAAAAPAPGALLLQSLLALPQLADDDDREQVDGILRLATAMYGVAGQQGQGQRAGASGGRPGGAAAEAAGSGSGGGGSGGGGSGSAVVAVEQAAAALRWLAAELQALPPAAQQQALLIPVEVAGRLTSRVTARLLKLLLAGGGGGGGSSSALAAGGARAQ